MAYEYDIFMSYPRRSPVGPWVQKYFHPLIETWLGAAMPRKPSIFLDVQMEVGTHWPSNLKESLHRSRLMIAVWAPPYFGSRWCLAEWKTMLARHEYCNLGRGHKHGLIYPIRFFDGDTFPPEAANTQDDHDFTRFNTFAPGFERTRRYQDFETKVQAMCLKLSNWIAAAPKWSNKWPVIEPEPGLGQKLSYQLVSMK